MLGTRKPPIGVRRNNGLHAKQKPDLIAAHAKLRLPFPIRDPAAAWDIIRAQVVVAFDMLEAAVYGVETGEVAY